MKWVISEDAFIRRNASIRESLRWVLTGLSRYRQGQKKDILLLSSRRSGSTWLMEVLGVEPGLRSLNEPFGPKFIHRSILATAPGFDAVCSGHRLFQLDEDLADCTARYMTEPALNRLSGPYNPLSPSFHFRYDRTLWKVIHANPAIDYFYQQADRFHTLLLLRHPCPTILSMMRKYEPELALILRNEGFCRTYVDDAAYTAFQDIERGGTLLEKFAAEWALEQVAPLRGLEVHAAKLRILSYEALLAEPEASVSGIANFCELSDPEKILRYLRYPSASTAGDRMQTMKRASAADLIGGWRKKLSGEEEKAVFRILERAGIDNYVCGNDFLNPQFLKRVGGEGS